MNEQVLRNYRDAAGEEQIKWVFDRLSLEKTLHLTSKEKE
jgi:hypothetical protein